MFQDTSLHVDAAYVDVMPKKIARAIEAGAGRRRCSTGSLTAGCWSLDR
jgi:hypothetical protein